MSLRASPASVGQALGVNPRPLALFARITGQRSCMSSSRRSHLTLARIAQKGRQPAVEDTVVSQRALRSFKRVNSRSKISAWTLHTWKRSSFEMMWMISNDGRFGCLQTQSGRAVAPLKTPTLLRMLEPASSELALSSDHLSPRLPFIELAVLPCQLPS